MDSMMMRRILPLVFLMPSLAHAALSIDGTPVGWLNGSGGTSATAVVTTTQTNDIIVVGSASNGAGITGISGGGLTFTQRTSTTSPTTEEWTAVASSTLSSVTLTISYGSTTYNTGVVIAVSGGNTSSPFDGNASIPVANNTAANPSFSTTSASTLVIAFLRFNSTGTATAGTGWTSAYAPSGGYFLAEYASFSSAQTGTTVAVGTGTGDENGSIVDALVPASGGGSCTHSAYTSSRTFAVPTAGSTSVWLSNRTFGTTPCDGTGTTWWSSTGAWETQ